MNTTSECYFSPVVVDNGTHTIKAGFGGDGLPRVVIPNCIGMPKPYVSVFHAMTSKAGYLGNDIQSKRGILRLRRSRKDDDHAICIDTQRKIWHHTFFKELRIAPEEHTIVMVDSPTGFIQTKHDIVQSLFEDFDFDGAYLADPVLFGLFRRVGK